MIPFVERDTRLHTCQPINDRPSAFECVARLVEIAGGARFEKPSVHAALIRGQRVGDIRAFRFRLSPRRSSSQIPLPSLPATGSSSRRPIAYRCRVPRTCRAPRKIAVQHLVAKLPTEAQHIFFGD